jgi:hypothetical protein
MTIVPANASSRPGRRSFECVDCGTGYSEQSSFNVLAADRALTLNFEASSRPH